ncbi:FemAB family XrtA/PEP-CTERM system-associated protein [Teredinibacter haidensis]|uniref:FemAB family XrtA/PEP-CTERM system-associated protein n=1 Tax=Teredinibacter haidensis TaxID=2731755 RepID=UPI0009F8F0F7|nr:FemAB family XrtA/PEP-CTERM system-associated protein [Teredinibacter haidensis]
MDVRNLRKDPESAIRKLYPEPSNVPSSLTRLLQQLQQSKQALKAHLETKKQCSSKFKLAKDEKEINALKEQMKQISAGHNTLIVERDNITDEIAATIEVLFPDNSMHPSLPCQFTYQPKMVFDNSQITIESVGDDFRDEWDRYASQHPAANLYHLYSWRRIIETVFKHKCTYLRASISEITVGLLPVIWIKSRIFGSYGVSIPFFNYGGPLSDNKSVTESLLTAAANVARESQMSHLEIRTTTPGYSWLSRSKKISMILELKNCKDEFNSNLGAKVRAQTKQADSFGAHISFGGIELLDDFYHIFSTNMRDLGTPVYSKKLFKTILANDSINSTIAVAYLGNKPSGTAFLIGFRQMLEIPWASTIRSANHASINMWMYHKILHFAIDRGYNFFDFGRSSKDSSTYRFKKQWGAKPVNHHWYYWLPTGGELPELNPENSKYKLAIKLWKKLPLFLTNRVGPYLVKNLP